MGWEFSDLFTSHITHAPFVKILIQAQSSTLRCSSSERARILKSVNLVIRESACFSSNKSKAQKTRHSFSCRWIVVRYVEPSFSYSPAIAPLCQLDVLTPSAQIYARHSWTPFRLTRGGNARCVSLFQTTESKSPVAPESSLFCKAVSVGLRTALAYFVFDFESLFLGPNQPEISEQWPFYGVTVGTHSIFSLK